MVTFANTTEDEVLNKEETGILINTMVDPLKVYLGKISIGDIPSAAESFNSDGGWITSITGRNLTSEIAVYTVNIDRSKIFGGLYPFEVMLSWSSNRAANGDDIR